MGIQGLTTFVKTFPNAWSRVELTHTDLIIDGNNLLHFLASKATFDSRCGGEYPDFYRMVRSFFASLRRSAVTPHILLDGVDNGDEKLATTQRRHIERMAEASRLVSARAAYRSNGFFPPLVHQVFLRAVADSDVDAIVCDHEADVLAIARARRDRCPLLSNDSDFFLANLPAGVVPVDSLEWIRDDDRGQVVYCTIFRRDLFFERVGLEAEAHWRLGPKYDVGPLLAVLLQNDLTDPDLLIPVYRKFKIVGVRRRFQIRVVIDQLRKYANVLEAEIDILGSESQLHACLVATKEFYYGSVELNEAVSNALGWDSSPFPEWAIASFRRGRFSLFALQAASLRRVFLLPQVETVASPCSHNASLHIRRALYDIAVPRRQDGGVVTVQEHRRCDNGNDPAVVSIEVPRNLPPLSCIPSLDRNERRDHLIQCIVGEWDCDIDHIEPEEFVLPMVTLFCWAYQCEEQPAENVIRAFILCFTNCHALLRKWEPVRDFHKRERPKGLVNFDDGLATAIARWQAIFSSSLHLNAVLGLPLPQVNPARFFDGFLVQRVYAECKKHQDFVNNCEQKDLFARLWTFMVESKPERKEIEVGNESESLSNLSCMQPSHEVKKKKKKRTVVAGSRFAGLEIEAESSEEEEEEGDASSN